MVRDAGEGCDLFVSEAAEADLIGRLSRLSPVAASAVAEAGAAAGGQTGRTIGTGGEALARLRSRAAAGDRVAEAGLRLAGPAGDSSADDDEMLPGTLYDAALRAEADGERRRSLSLLIAALTDPSADPALEADGCLGLAVLALEARAFEDAALLAERCLQLHCRHPRACAILGFVRAREGRTEEAKTFLAAAARIARRDPRLRGDLDAAQRTLLLLQLAA